MRPWTEKEVEYLIKHRGEKSTAEIGRLLKRTEDSVDHKCRRLGTGTLIDNSDWLTLAEVVRVTGMYKGTIYNKWVASGLNTKRIGRLRFATQDDLAEFMRENPNRWDWKRCDESYFSRYPWWLEIKQADSNGFNRRKGMMTEHEITSANMMRDQGKTINEIADWLNRSPYTVIGLFRRQSQRMRIMERGA